ncbi:MAG: 4Fe-4S binding protein, partial [Proteobacteria bacterium]|nr:4Fe-4S binding protein [Pseudomonadota bacterium]
MNCTIRSLLFIFGLMLPLCATAGDLTKADIEKRFQDRAVQVGAARASGDSVTIGDKLKDVPAWPVYSEKNPNAGPVFYVFETFDLAPIPGFEGTPMNLLVEMDANGKFVDVQVLRQHEPVFLGGLGPAVFDEYLKQYRGISIKQQIKISTGQSNRSAGNVVGPNTVVFDGISKATASIRIANQSVLNSAFTVARTRLGFAGGAADSGPPAVVKKVAFEKLDVDTLIKRGYMQRLTLTNAEVEKLFVGTDGAGVDEEALLHPNDLFLELFIANLNPPNIGRNLLGDEAWNSLESHLQDDRAAFWVATRGRFPLVDDTFIPGSSPARIELVQSELPVQLRDTNRDYARAPAVPDLNASLILAVPPLAGLDPGKPMDFRFSITRARGAILPVLTQKQVTLRYAPASEFFEFPPKPLPEWLMAWKGRLLEIVVIFVSLVVLSVVLLRPRAISIKPRALFWFRMIFLAFTLFGTTSFTLISEQ